MEDDKKEERNHFYFFIKTQTGFIVVSCIVFTHLCASVAPFFNIAVTR
jgi:hypothetical protein